MKEKQIEEMANIIETAKHPIEYDENTYSVTVYPAERDIAAALIDAGYGNVKQAVKEFAEKLKAEFFFIKTTANKDAIYQFTDSQLDNLLTELYGADE